MFDKDLGSSMPPSQHPCGPWGRKKSLLFDEDLGSSMPPSQHPCGAWGWGV